MGWSHGKHWSEERVRAELMEVAEQVGRMPSVRELHSLGRRDLACAVARRGGFRSWALRLGLNQKETETHRGQRWERHEAALFRSMGLEVEEQPTKAPFDLLVNGHRVDVKSSTWRDYGYVKGYFFNGIKHGEDCDFFVLLCVKKEEVLHRFVVPAGKAKCKTLTISSSSISGDGPRKKWCSFKGAVHLLKG